MARLSATDLVWTVEIVSVVGQVRAGVVAARTHENREAGGSFFNHVNLPVSQHGIERPIPGRAELFALSKGQVVDHTRGEIIIELDLGQPPIRSRGVRERPVS